MRYRWQDPPITIPAGAPVESALATLLAARGVDGAAAVAAFLKPTPSSLADPLLMADLARALDRLGVAHRRGEMIAVWGDYDVDGLSSTALLCQALGGMGFRVRPHVPHRVRDGYGLNTVGLDRLAEEGVTLLIAVDCGTSNGAEIAHARALGLDTIVLDHHHVRDEEAMATGAAGAVAFVNPRRADCPYPFKEHAAVGVAYTLVRALVREGFSLGGPWGEDEADLLDLLDLVALGTVADVVPLQGENRTLVVWGLDALRHTAHPGLLALCRIAGIEPARLRSWDIGHVIGPRLNAAGRIAEPELALRLLLSRSAAEAEPLAAELDRLNRERQRELARIVGEATARVEADGPPGDDLPLLQIDGAGWTAGVVGLVASRLTERYARPVIILERGDRVSKGSARSVEGFNMIEALTACDDLLHHYGGHSRAAGLTVANEDLPALHERLVALAAARLDAERLRPTLALDIELPPAALSADSERALARLEPFGHGNPEPLLLVCGVEARWPKGSADGKHLFFTIPSPGGGRGMRAVAFGQGARVVELRQGARIDLAGSLRRDLWAGEERVEFHVRDFRLASGA